MSKVELRECCGTPINAQHSLTCDLGVDLDKVNRSFWEDPVRWEQSYRKHNSQSMRLKALAVRNGQIH